MSCSVGMLIISIPPWFQTQSKSIESPKRTQSVECIGQVTRVFKVAEFESENRVASSRRDSNQLRLTDKPEHLL